MWSDLLSVLKEYGAFGLMALMVGLGLLIPRSFHRERIADKDKQIATLQATVERLERQRDELTELARTTVAVVQALPKAKETL
jgi:hypothetical protein